MNGKNGNGNSNGNGSGMNAVQAAIEQLEKDGCKVEFAHWRREEHGSLLRYSRKEGWIANDHNAVSSELIKAEKNEVFGDPCPSGGCTDCCILIDAEYGGDVHLPHVYGTADCRSDEQFCYAQGRRVALVRAIESFIDANSSADNECYNSLRGKLWREIHEYWKGKGQLQA